MAAFFAGYHPKNTPVKVQTRKERMTLQGCMYALKLGNSAETPNDRATPNITPITPPVTLSRIDSIRNCVKISMPFAPILIRRPISRVRSVTDTYIMFIIPIPPTISEIPATAANEIVNRGFREDKCSFLDMSEIIENTMNRVAYDKTPDYDTYVATDREARIIATELMK